MKKFFSKWINRNKIILIIFAVASVLLFTVTWYELNLILKHLPELKEYADTGVITDSLQLFGIIGIFNIIIFAVWVLLLIVLMWNTLFPSKEAAKNAFHVSDFEFLMSLPSNLRREMKKRNE